ncbi:hypothetical protein BJY01DRAFT_131771 [Aspergillus pseudoustus]|uniref:Zn(2)-C6 fungal-type domain-containing protein n=1 Tax=Aspergillus pseudoustus TaxID=1810923 RepID=A0ABR4IKX1_9EURO
MDKSNWQRSQPLPQFQCSQQAPSHLQFHLPSLSSPQQRVPIDQLGWSQPPMQQTSSQMTPQMPSRTVSPFSLPYARERPPNSKSSPSEQSYPYNRKRGRSNAPLACELCRCRKTRCSGEAGGCSNCDAANSICVYSYCKREQNKGCAS